VYTACSEDILKQGQIADPERKVQKTCVQECIPASTVEGPKSLFLKLQKLKLV